MTDAERRCRIWVRAPDAVSREAGVELEEALLAQGFERAVHRALHSKA